MRLPLVTPVDTRDGTSDKDGRMHNVLLETDEGGDVAALRPGLAQTAGTTSGSGNGLVNFNNNLISVYGSKLMLPTDGSYDSYATLLPDFKNWSAIAYGGDTWVSLPYTDLNAEISYSTDGGLTWNTTTSEYTAQWDSIAYGNGVFVGIAYAATYDAVVSADGITWNQYAIGINQPSPRWDDIAFNGSVFCIIRYNGASAATSSDGQTWTEYAMASTANWQVITSFNGTFVAVASGTKSAISSDGTSWTEGSLDNYDWYCIAASTDRVVVLGYGSDKGAYSSDGLTWTTVTLPSSANWKALVWTGDVFCGFAQDGGTMIYSVDGSEWVSVDLQFSNSFFAAATDGEVVIAVPYGGTYGDSAIYVTPPGGIRSIATLSENFFDFAQSTL